jgi:Kef-type K+ transport system membrane component KefB
MDSLTYLALVWTAVFIAIVAAKKTKLTPVLYYLALGSFMVNTGILPEDTDPFIRGFADVGIILIMFALGFEENTTNFLHSIRKSWGIAFFGAVGPFVAAYLVADYFWQDHAIALMCGLTMTATAVSLTMVSLKSEGLAKSAVATRIMTSAVLDDIASLALIAILIPLATGEATLDIANISWIIFKAVEFFILVSVISIWILPHDTGSWMSHVPIIGRYGIKHLLAFDNGKQATLAVLLLALLVGLLAHYFGFHPAVGAYMAGLILKEDYFLRDKKRDSYKATWRIVDNVAFSWIGPVFFVDLGSKLVFHWDIFTAVIPNTLALILAVFIVQVGTASVAARYTSNMGWSSSLMVGFGMLGRAELAFVVMDIAYVQNNIITTEVFYTLMFTAFWLNVAVPLTISWWKPYYLKEKQQQKASS